jgi:thiosulfate dehydrogenase [quinone] large subunit
VNQANEYLTDQYIAFLLLRVTIGINFACHSFQRWQNLSGFVDGMVRDFANTPLPAFLIKPFALSVPFVEPLIGVSLLLGLFTRQGLIVAVMLMIALTFGTALEGQFQNLGIQLLYALVLCVLLFSRRFNNFSLDALIEKYRKLPAKTPTS